MKPPAFQCYADDLLAGTSDMTAEEFGVYWRLICHSWNKGGLPNDDSRLALMAGQCTGSAVAYAKTKFELGEDGLLRNPRLEKVRIEQETYRKNQSDKAHLRWDKVKGRTDAAAHAPAQALECSPSPSPTPEDVNRESRRNEPEANLPTWPEVKLMAEQLCIAEAVAREFYDHHEGNCLWTNRHGILVNVKVKLQIWNNNVRQGKVVNGNHRNASKQSTDRNAGTFNGGHIASALSKKVR